MAKPPAFQFYPKDYIVSTRTMPVEARGVYTDLLAYAWVEEGLPADLKGLEAFIGLSRRKFTTIFETYLSDRWTSDGNGKLVNQRQEEEREKQLRWREKSAKGGKAGRKGS